MKLDVKALALACGILWGLGLFFGTWWVILLDGASGEPTVIASVYRGYSLSAAGSLIGLIWAFVDGLIGGALIAWLYNRFAARGARPAA